MTDSSIQDLAPQLQPIASEWLRQANLNAPTKITVTWRGAADQDHAKAYGLSNAGAGQSPHNCTVDGQPASLAFDFAIFDQNGRYITDGTDPRYAHAGQIGKALGLHWGGDWLHPDFDHLEVANWRASAVADETHQAPNPTPA